MMIKKYKIGNFTLEIKSQADFDNAEPYSLFSYEGEQTDYTVSVEFSSGFPESIDNPDFTTQDKVCIYRNGVLHCFYKARDTEDSFYASRTTDGKNIKIVIVEKYRDMLRAGTIFTLIGIEELVAQHNACLLHSSFIETHGSAVLFTGPCSIGKSTQADLWKKYADAAIVNGDKTIIFEKDGVFYASGLPSSGSSKYCINKVLPLKAVIGLQQAGYNTAERLSSIKAFYTIYKNCYPVPYSRKFTDNLIDFAQRLSQSIPIYEFACLADESAVRYLERELCPILQNP